MTPPPPQSGQPDRFFTVFFDAFPKLKGISVKMIVTSCTQGQMKSFSYKICGHIEKWYPNFILQSTCIQSALPRCAPRVLSISTRGMGLAFRESGQPVFHGTRRGEHAIKFLTREPVFVNDFFTVGASLVLIKFLTRETASFVIGYYAFGR